jgi:hypothetical protein
LWPSSSSFAECSNGIDHRKARFSHRSFDTPFNRILGSQPIASRGVTKRSWPREAREPEQYQWFDTPEYRDRVLVTHLKEAIDLLLEFYPQRAGAENPIKEAHHDAGRAAHPSGRSAMNGGHFQWAGRAYNRNCWVRWLSREAQAQAETLQHNTRATSRLRFPSWRLKSGGTPVVGGAAAITMPRRACGNGSWIACARSPNRITPSLPSSLALHL